MPVAGFNLDQDNLENDEALFAWLTKTYGTKSHIKSEDVLPPLTYQRCLELSKVDSYSTEAKTDGTEGPGAEDTFESIRTLKTLRLDWQGLSTVPSLIPFENLINLYLQHNQLGDEIWTDVGSLKRVEFMALQHNCLTTVRGIKDLKSLQVLDVSYNAIDFTRILEELPSSICILNTINQEPVAVDINEKQTSVSGIFGLADTFAVCPSLVVLDGKEVEIPVVERDPTEDKLKAIGDKLNGVATAESAKFTVGRKPTAADTAKADKRFITSSLFDDTFGKDYSTAEKRRLLSEIRTQWEYVKKLEGEVPEDFSENVLVPNVFNASTLEDSLSGSTDGMASGGDFKSGDYSNSKSKESAVAAAAIADSITKDPVENFVQHEHEEELQLLRTLSELSTRRKLRHATGMSLNKIAAEQGIQPTIIRDERDENQENDESESDSAASTLSKGIISKIRKSGNTVLPAIEEDAELEFDEETPDLLGASASLQEAQRLLNSGSLSSVTTEQLVEMNTVASARDYINSLIADTKLEWHLEEQGRALKELSQEPIKRFEEPLSKVLTNLEEEYKAWKETQERVEDMLGKTGVRNKKLESIKLESVKQSGAKLESIEETDGVKEKS